MVDLIFFLSIFHGIFLKHFHMIYNFLGFQNLTLIQKEKKNFSNKMDTNT